MRARTVLWLALTLFAAAPLSAGTTASINLQLNLGNAPPPPVLVYRDEPHVVIVPGSSVYVVDDGRCNFDFFRCGVYWYIWNDGYWYRGRSYGGPFAVVDTKYVPATIMNVPARHWKHHPHGGAPGQMKRRGDMYVSRERPDADRGREGMRGRGRGHGRDRGRDRD
jgi:hypothetical protein